MRIIFMGTPEFSVPCLQSLLDAPDIDIVGVVTQPDKPSGRGQKLTPPPVKVLADQHGIPVQQPKRLRKDDTVMSWMEELKPDYLVTIAFGQILPKRVLDCSTHGTVNVHASLLPDYRGPNPIQWAVLNGDRETGLTTMLSDEGVDTGAMLLKETTPISSNETTLDVAIRLANMSGPLLLKTLQAHHSGDLKPSIQNDALATQAPKLAKEDAFLDWHQPATTLHNQIRAYQPWPGAVAFLGNLRLKLLQTEVLNPSLAGDLPQKELTPGTIVSILKEGVVLATTEGYLLLKTVQPAGKKAMPAADWGRNALKVDQSERLSPSPL